ncbi:MAG: hypothetical protein ACRDNK_08360 [Solirubrobacteraceae bacterium]
MGSRRWPLSMLLCALLLAGAVVAARAGPAAAATRRSPTLAPANTVVDGPSADITGLNGLAVARDGTGGLVYLKSIAGVAHVFVSGLRAGAFQAPVQVDTGLAGPSSQPVIAATNGGLTLVAFINAGQLYVVQQTNALSPWQAPAALYGSGASNPSLSISTFGKAYLAFTALGSGGHDIHAAYFNQGQWTAVPAPLDANASDDAGTGPGRPQVATAGDGTAIVAWGEHGHVYTRRVLGSAPSIAFQQADPPSFAGFSEVSADQPAVGAGGDSSYAAVAFHEVVTSGGVKQSRVLVNRLHAGQYDGAVAADSPVTPGGEGATSPRVSVTEFGTGWISAQGDQSNNAFLTNLTTNDSVASHEQLNSLPQGAPPDTVPATAGIVSTLLAWQQTGTPEIRVRYAPDGTHLDPDLTVSSPALGAANADLGLFAGGDLAGDAAIAWVQNIGSQSQIVTAQLFQAPKAFAPSTRFGYSTSANPVLSWSAPSELWGPLTYTVKLDGAVVGSSQSPALQTAAPVAQGRHVWQVSAANLAGLTSTDRASVVFVDSLPPQVRPRITGARHVGDLLHIYVRDTDRPPGLPASAGSGVVSLQVKWGDGTKAFIKHAASHAYRRRRTFTVTVIAFDRAGNRTVITKRVKVTPKPKRKHKKGKRRKHTTLRHTIRHAGIGL